MINSFYKYKETGNTPTGDTTCEIAGFGVNQLEVVFLRNKERDPLLHLFNVAPAVLGLFLAPYTKLAFVPVVMATIILIGVIL